MFENIDYSPGKVVFFDFDIDANLPLNKQYNIGLKEDMLQVKYPYAITLDAGWLEGIKKFVIYIVKKSDWDKPILKKTCKNLKSFKAILLECIQEVRKIIEEEEQRPRFKSMIIEEIDFSPGMILYNDLLYINPNIPLIQQVSLLSEQMLRVEYAYNHHYLIEVGWYVEANQKGHFKIDLLKSFGDDPFNSQKTTDLKTLCEYVKKGIEIIRKLGSKV